jgi:hypothetical protein
MPELGNSSIFPLIIGIIVMGSVYYVIFKFRYDRRRISELYGEDLRFDDIRAVHDKLKKGETPNPKDVNKFAKSLEHRILLYEALNQYDKLNLFPSEFLSIEHLGESYLANWLNFHDEFDAMPNEISYHDTVRLENQGFVLIYKFKVYEPHLMASKGFMMGYVAYLQAISLDDVETPDAIFTHFDHLILSKEQLHEAMLKEKDSPLNATSV